MASKSPVYNNTGGILKKKSPMIRSRKNVEVNRSESESHHTSQIADETFEGKDNLKFIPMRRCLSSPELLVSSSSIHGQHTTDRLSLNTVPSVHFDPTYTQTNDSASKRPNPFNPTLPSPIPTLATPIHETEDTLLSPHKPITPNVSGRRSRFKSDLELYTHTSSQQGYEDNDDFMDGLSDDDNDDYDDAPRKKNYRRSSAAYIVHENQTTNRRKAMLGGCCWCWFTSLDKPSWNRISAFIVRNAPCFWCCGERIETSITNRMIVMRLNILCLIFALLQVASGFFLFYLTCLTKPARRDITNKAKYWREALIPNLWTPSGSITLLAVVGLAIFATILLSRRSIRQFNLKGSIRYLWTLYWLIPLEIFLVISLVDYHKVTNVWVYFWWPTASMAWFRQIFCYGNTADTTCRIKCNPSDTSCNNIQSHATSLMVRSSYVFFYSNAAVGLILILLLILTLSMLERLITAPIVQKSKERNVPLWLTLPTIGCLAVGSVLLYSPSSVLNQDSTIKVYWIGVCYICTGGAFGFSALLGWCMSVKTVYSTRDKTRKLGAICIFIAMMCLTIMSIASILSASIIFSIRIVTLISDTERGELACFIDSACSCSNCNVTYCDTNGIFNSSQTWCPEWSTEDVLSVMRTQLKQSASVACIFLIYALGALRFGFNLFNHVKRYEIDYV